MYEFPEDKFYDIVQDPIEDTFNSIEENNGEMLIRDWRTMVSPLLNDLEAILNGSKL